jgi:hypothetical protein
VRGDTSLAPSCCSCIVAMVEEGTAVVAEEEGCGGRREEGFGR